MHHRVCASSSNKMYTSLGEQEASAQFGSLRRIKEEIQTLTWSQLRK